MQSRSPAVCQQSDALRSNPPEPHDDERLSLLLTDLMDHANVGMVQGGCHLRFSLNPRQRLRIFGSVVRQELQGYESVARRSVRLTTKTRCFYIHRRSVPVPGAARSMVGLSPRSCSPCDTRSTAALFPGPVSKSPGLLMKLCCSVSPFTSPVRSPLLIRIWDSVWQCRASAMPYSVVVEFLAPNSVPLLD